jgi:hypothetical protein
MDVSNENKRTLIIILFALLVVAAIIFLMFYNRPLDRQIIGTWQSRDGIVQWTFDRDGVFTISGGDEIFIARYELNGAQLIFIDPEEPDDPLSLGFVEINNRDMILLSGNSIFEFRKR